MRKVLVMFGIGVGLVVVAAAQTAREAGGDWPYPGADAGGTRYSTLTQINTSNVKSLKRVWTFHTGSGRFASSPMVVDSLMYFSAPNGVYAIDAVTGKQIWKYAPPRTAAPSDAASPAAGRGRGARAAGARAGAGQDGAAPAGGRATGRGARGGNANDDSAGTATRGPAYWPGANGVGPRVYSYTTAGLAAIDAKTGTLVTTFGEHGILPAIRANSPPVIYKEFLITKGPDEPGKGVTVKAFDILSGQPRWSFYLKAQPGDPNRATWLNGSADTIATPNMWGFFTVDEERGTLFIPIKKTTGNGINDYWGGPAPGPDLYSDCLVALDATTGKMKWYRQLLHHDIWDFDLAAAPILVDVRRNGQIIPAVVQTTKFALMFILNRETGEPIFGMAERPVPQTTVPGEWTSPTQPFPLKPPPLARNSFKKSELSTVTPEHQAFCQNLWDTNKLSDTVPYTPWKVGENVLVFPGAEGGSNWWGATFNKPLGLIIANVHDIGQWGHLEPSSGGNYTKTPGPFQRFWDTSKSWSCTQPPWGELVAVNANTGDIAWHVTLGAFPELEAKGIKSGTPSSGGAITTAGNLVFIGATLDSKFRAFDARNGDELWSDTLPTSSQGTPTTYMGGDGKQYVVIGANGGGFFGAPVSDEVIAYALP
jgi:glucose dehydrogenase